MNNENYVVAGGSKGIGHELVRTLIDRADRVDVLSREIDDLEVGGHVTHIPFDFTSDDTICGLPDVIHGAAYCPGSINRRSTGHESNMRWTGH